MESENKHNKRLVASIAYQNHPISEQIDKMVKASIAYQKPLISEQIGRLVKDSIAYQNPPINDLINKSLLNSRESLDILNKQINTLNSINTKLIASQSFKLIDSLTLNINKIRLDFQSINLRNFDLDSFEEQMTCFENEINFNSDGTISSGEGLYTLEEINSSINAFFEDKDILTASQFENGINKLISKLPEQNSLVRQILITLITTIILSFFSFCFNTSIDFFSQPNKRNAETKIVVREMTTRLKLMISSAYLKNYRIITTECLNVRSKNSTKSQLIGKVYVGQVVEVIDKKKNWSLVEYRSADSEIIIRGWVFTRYTKKLDK